MWVPSTSAKPPVAETLCASHLSAQVRCIWCVFAYMCIWCVFAYMCMFLLCACVHVFAVCMCACVCCVHVCGCLLCAYVCCVHVCVCLLCACVCCVHVTMAFFVTRFPILLCLWGRIDTALSQCKLIGLWFVGYG